MRVLLSIKPQYAEAILNGNKKVEFRKTPIRKSVSEALIYMSRTKKRIVGSASISEVIEDSPENLWKRFGNIGGIDRDSFFDYFSGKKRGFALVLSNPTSLSESEYIKPVYVPQSFCYI